MTQLARFDPLHYEDGMIECSNGDYVEWAVFEKCDRERRDLIDTVKAMLVACGGSNDDTELERQCKAAGDKSSDFIAAVGGRLLNLIAEWQASGRHGYCLPVIQTDLMDDIERIQRGEALEAEDDRQCMEPCDPAVGCEICAGYWE